jgi:hypothetical protein
MTPFNSVTNPYAYNAGNYQSTTQPPGRNPQNGLISISGGEESALNYGLEPGSTVLLLSSDTNEMFMRGTDANGMTNLFRAFDIKEKMPQYQSNMMEQNLENYATKEDVKALSGEIAELRKFLEDLTSPNVKG